MKFDSLQGTADAVGWLEESPCAEGDCSTLISMNRYLHIKAESVGKRHDCGTGSILVSTCPFVV